MSVPEDLSDRASALRERVDRDYPDAWDFKELPALVGVVESYARVDTAYGPKVVCTVREVEGAAPRRYAVWLSQTALFNRFRDLDIREGELVAIRYLGQADHAERGRSPAHRFRVEVDRAGSAFEWGELEADHAEREREPAPFAGGADPPPHGDDDIPF